MNFTVRDLLKMETLKEAKLYGGFDALNCDITGVNIIESPEIVDFMQRGEVLLTGMYAFKGCSILQFEQYLEKMVSNRIGILIVKKHYDNDEYADKFRVLREFAEENDFPVAVIPYSVSFRALLVKINEKIFNEEITKLKYFKSTHDNFNALISSKAYGENSISEILNALSTMLGNPVSLYDSDRNCICTTEVEKKPLRFYGDLREIESDFYSSQKYSIQTVFDEYNPHSDPSKKYEQLIAHVRDYHKQKVYMAVSYVNQKFNSLDIIAVENAMFAVKELLIRQQIMEGTEQKYQDNIWNNILYGKIKLPNELDKAAENLNINPHDKFRVIALQIEYSFVEDGTSFEDKLITKAIARNIVQKCFFNCSTCDEAERLLIIQTGSNVEALTEIKKKINDKILGLMKLLKDAVNVVGIKCGIGNEVPDIAFVRESFDEAASALDFAGVLGESIGGEDLKYLAFSDMGIFHLLCNLSSKEEMEKYIPETLKKLYRFKKPQRDDLISTLKCYLNNNQNLARTAQELYVHYKTAAYRIERITQITGIDFDDPRDVLSVRIGLIIGEVINYIHK